MTDNISILTAFAAGLVSFLSPCVLPLVPGYISYMSGLSLEELSKGTDKSLAIRKAGLGSISFVAGFSLVFTLLGASASAVGQFLSEYIGLLSKIAGILIIFFGLHMTGLLELKWLYYEKRFNTQKVSSGILGSFIMGLAFAFGWTPCIGPILAGILALAATQDSVYKGILLLFVYSMGLGLPFILTGFGVNLFMQFFNRYKKYIRWGEIFSGVLLIFVGGLIFSNKLTLLIGFFPDWLNKFAI